MSPVNIPFSGSSPGDDLLPVLVIYGVLWLLSLARVLLRNDWEPVTKLTWVVVVIFVPVFGILFYWFLAPDSPSLFFTPREKKGSDSSHQLSGTPWENDSGHLSKSKWS
jgi:hypothetical protein